MNYNLKFVNNWHHRLSYCPRSYTIGRLGLNGLWFILYNPFKATLIYPCFMIGQIHGCCNINILFFFRKKAEIRECSVKSLKLNDWFLFSYYIIRELFLFTYYNIHTRRFNSTTQPSQWTPSRDGAFSSCSSSSTLAEWAPTTKNLLLNYMIHPNFFFLSLFLWLPCWISKKNFFFFPQSLLF